MSEKRTKADKAQRQADQLEKKASRRPAQTQKETDPRRTSAKPLRPNKAAFLGGITFSSSAVHSKSCLATGLSGRPPSPKMTWSRSCKDSIRSAALHRR